MKRIFLDTETSGLRPGQIGQLSIIIVTDSEKEGEAAKIESYNYYFEMDYIERGAEEACGRGLDFYKEASGGRKFKDDAAEIFNLLKDGTVIAHNVKFDNNFLSTEFWRLGLTYAPQGVFDTMAYFKDVLKIPGRRTMYKNPKLCEVTNFLGITEKDIEEETARLFDSGAVEFHDATFDTAALYLIYLKESERRANGKKENL